MGHVDTGYDDAVELVTRLVCRFRTLDSSQLSVTDDLADTLGFDSLDAAELVAAIHQETGRELGVTSYQDLRTVQNIASHLAESLSEGSAAQ
jgi:acyl carrier protein